MQPGHTWGCSACRIRLQAHEAAAAKEAELRDELRAAQGSLLEAQGAARRAESLRAGQRQAAEEEAAGALQAERAETARVQLALDEARYLVITPSSPSTRRGR